MRKLLIGTAAAMALMAGSAIAQDAGGGPGTDMNTTAPRAGQSTMSPGSSGASGGNWSAGNPGGTTAGSGATGGYTAKGTATAPGSLSTTGSPDGRSSPTAPGQGREYDTLEKQNKGVSGSSTTTTTTKNSGSSGSSSTTTGGAVSTKKADPSATSAQRATGSHAPPGTPESRPGNQGAR